MDIVPVPGLRKYYDIDAWLTSDLTSIYVDDGLADNFEARYRFSLAHELAHKILHADVFAQLEFSTASEWKEARLLIDEREYGILEWQANFTAGMILVPPDELAVQFRKATERLHGMGYALDDALPFVWDVLEKILANAFFVSSAVISKRGPADDLWEA